MDVLAIVAGVIAGLGSGFLSALFSPVAQRRAEETRIKQEQRRKLISDARALVAEALEKDWRYYAVGSDTRYLALRPHLSDDVQRAYVPVSSLSLPQAVDHMMSTSGPPNHEPLSRAVDELERSWNLI